MELIKNNKVLFAASIGYILLNALLLYFEIYLGLLFPLLLLLIWWTVTDIRKVFLLLVFFTPLSLPLSELIGEGFSSDLSLPTEPILALLLLLAILNFCLHPPKLLPDLLKHPVILAVAINLGWMAITAIGSTMPLVSFKFFLARLWFVIPLLFGLMLLFRSPGFIFQYIGAYGIALFIVVLYTLFHLVSVDILDKQVAHLAMTPFFKDHTSYGAILAMFLPVIASFLFMKRYNPVTKMLLFFSFLVFFLGTVFSYTRAAWLSLFAAGALLLFIALKLRMRFFVGLILTVAILFFSFQFEILDSLSKNKQDSSGKMEEHLQSMTNIATDASNLERINRWKSAFNMFKEKPLTGFGPGTYMFQYAPYQMAKDRTIISTNFGEVGNAHSEYIGALAESGLPGMLSFVGIVFCTLFVGIRRYYRLPPGDLKVLLLGVLLGLSTYYVHGFLNNFLDTDKASVLFWGFTGIVVLIDIYAQKGKELPL